MKTYLNVVLEGLATCNHGICQIILWKPFGKSTAFPSQHSNTPVECNALSFFTDHRRSLEITFWWKNEENQHNFLNVHIMDKNDQIKSIHYIGLLSQVFTDLLKHVSKSDIRQLYQTVLEESSWTTCFVRQSIIWFLQSADHDVCKHNMCMSKPQVIKIIDHSLIDQGSNMPIIQHFATHIHPYLCDC